MSCYFMGMKLPENLRQKLDKCWIQDTASAFLAGWSSKLLDVRCFLVTFPAGEMSTPKHESKSHLQK